MDINRCTDFKTVISVMLNILCTTIPPNFYMVITCSISIAIMSIKSRVENSDHLASSEDQLHFLNRISPAVHGRIKFNHRFTVGSAVAQ